MPRLALPVALPLALLAGPALASSEDAWAEFRAAVETECTALADIPDGASLAVEVNPFGSESYGVALLVVTLADGTADRIACVYDKTTHKAELTAPFPSR